jgi:xanthine phosphoribosyltransferase
MKKTYYSYKECIDDCKVLLPKLKLYDPDTIVPIARGGLTLGHILSEAMNIRDVSVINSIHYDDTKKLDSFEIFNIPDLSKAKKVLIVDDIVDSGETIVEVLKVLKQKYPTLKYKVVSLYYKTTAIFKPDFYAKEANGWIEFFWEKDLRLKKLSTHSDEYKENTK